MKKKTVCQSSFLLKLYFDFYVNAQNYLSAYDIHIYVFWDEKTGYLYIYCIGCLRPSYIMTEKSSRLNQEGLCLPTFPPHCIFLLFLTISLFTLDFPSLWHYYIFFCFSIYCTYISFLNILLFPSTFIFPSHFLSLSHNLSLPSTQYFSLPKSLFLLLTFFFFPFIFLSLPHNLSLPSIFLLLSHNLCFSSSSFFFFFFFTAHRGLRFYFIYILFPKTAMWGLPRDEIQTRPEWAVYI